MNDTTDARSCPICGGLDHEPHVAIDRGNRRFDIVRCVSCRFVFVANPGAPEFEREQDEPAAIPEKPRHRQIKRVCDHILGRRLRAGGRCRIVEVGAGWGGLAHVFSRDERYQYAGFEPSVARAAYCRARGLDVREGLFDGAELAGAVDGIVFDNVLEHVLNPVVLVAAAVSSLRERGALIVIVPNVNDIRRFHRAWRLRHHWQPHCHVNYFSAANLEVLFGRHGMKCRFFGFEAASRRGDDIALLPRIFADMLGVHLLGLNCYGVKPGGA